LTLSCYRLAVRILVVDDNVAVRRAIARLLRRDHTVGDVGTAEEARAEVRRGERFDVLVTDFHLPDMTGAELHEHVTGLAPHLREATVVVTGAADRPSVRLAVNDRAPMLAKPFVAEHLRDIVASFAVT
jgi:DNA-binding NtrC family response regulator